MGRASSEPPRSDSHDLSDQDDGYRIDDVQGSQLRHVVLGHVRPDARRHMGGTRDW
jgi:hypothetical protein